MMHSVIFSYYFMCRISCTRLRYSGLSEEKTDLILFFAFASRYFPGVIPVIALKHLVKCCRFEKPVSIAISIMLYDVFSSRRLADSILSFKIWEVNVSPLLLTNNLCRYESLIPQAAAILPTEISFAKLEAI